MKVIQATYLILACKDQSFFTLSRSMYNFTFQVYGEFLNFLCARVIDYHYPTSNMMYDLLNK